MKIVRISAVWCSSCIVTYKDFKNLKEKYPLNTYIELDYDMDDISKYNVGKILPVVILYKGDVEVSRFSGEVDIKKIEEKL